MVDESLSEGFAGLRQTLVEREERMRSSISEQGKSLRGELHQLTDKVHALELAIAKERAVKNGEKALAGAISGVAAGLQDLGELKSSQDLVIQRLSAVEKLTTKLEGRIWQIVGASSAVGGIVGAVVVALAKLFP